MTGTAGVVLLGIGGGVVPGIGTLVIIPSLAGEGVCYAWLALQFLHCPELLACLLVD